MFVDIGPSPRSGRQHKARGGAEGGTPGQVRSDIKPVKRAAAVAHFVGYGSLYYLSPGAHAPGFMLSGGSAGSKRGS